MRKITLLFLLVFAIAENKAQNYQITFAGTGASTIVDSVKIENLSQCTSLNIGGGNILNLGGTVGLNDINLNNNKGTIIYPNPATGACSVEFTSTSGNNTRIELFDMTGKVVVEQSGFLTAGDHRFLFKGLKSGVYTLKIESDVYQYSAKLVSNYSTPENPVIENAGNTAGSLKQLTVNDNLKQGYKSIKSTIFMQFNAGDTLKLTGKSGNCRTVTMLFPNQDQTVPFDFMQCTDADSNHYAVVQIGNQIWMEENLKTTKYRDGSSISNVTDSATWGSTTNGAWCNFLNDPAEGAYYGRLYNYYAVADSRNLCPAGWHVAKNAEWNIMEKLIDSTVDTTALGVTGAEIGRILKEGCNTRWQYYDSTAGWNSAGFSALCTNFRNSTGAWSLAPNNNHDDSYWTASPYNVNMAWSKSFRWCTRDIFSIFNYKRAGSGVRCIKDN